MANREDIMKMSELHRQLLEEDKQFSEQLRVMEDDFVRFHQINKQGFDKLYGDAEKNFRLDFGTVCEKGRDQVIDGLRSGKDKQHVTNEYLTCVEMTRQKAAQRASQGSP